MIVWEAGDHVHLVSFKLHAGTVKIVSFLYTDLGSLRLLLLSLGAVKTDKGQTSGFLKIMDLFPIKAFAALMSTFTFCFYKGPRDTK